MPAAELVTVPGVPLVKVGNWPAVTGPASITAEKIRSMVAASQQSWWDGAPVKPGHFDKRFKAARDGDPALGWAQNLRIETDSDGGEVLVGDYVDVPSKAVHLLKSAYKNRSIEWREDEVGPDGKTYPAVLTGVAVLGATPPGVTGLGRIEALDDVLELFAAGSADSGTHRAFVGDDAERIAQALSVLSEVIHVAEDQTGHDMPDNTVYGGPMADIPEARLRELLDIGVDADILATLEERKATASDTPAPPVEEPKPDGNGDDKPADEPKPEPQPVAEVPAGFTLVPESTLATLQAQAQRGEEAWKAQQAETIEAEVKAASRAGKILPAEIPAYVELLSKDVEQGRKMLSARPVMFSTSETEIGTAMLSAGNSNAAANDFDATYNSLVSRYGQSDPLDAIRGNK